MIRNIIGINAIMNSVGTEMIKFIRKKYILSPNRPLAAMFAAVHAVGNAIVETMANINDSNAQILRNLRPPMLEPMFTSSLPIVAKDFSVLTTDAYFTGRAAGAVWADGFFLRPISLEMEIFFCFVFGIWSLLYKSYASIMK